MATRILYVITKASWGGAQHYVSDLSVDAQKQGYEVAVAYGSPGDLSGRLHDANVRTIPIESLARDVHIGKDIAVLFELVRLFKQEHPDVVHLNSAKASGLGALAARIAGVPHIFFTAHGWAFNEDRPWWQKILIGFLSGMTVYLAHTTICVSDAVRRDIAWLPFSKKKLAVVHNGIICGPLLLRETARESLLPHHKPRFWIGMISELHPTKCIVSAIFAMATLVKKHPEAILVILGEGEERARLEKAIRALELTDHVFLVGFIPEGSSYMTAFDIFLQASLSEALGFAILEAGCATLPVVATNVGGIPEIIESGMNGILVPPERSEEIARALSSLIEAPELRQQLGKALEKTVSTRFSKRAMIDKTFALYGR